jgi:lysophospholipid hydrolase
VDILEKFDMEGRLPSAFMNGIGGINPGGKKKGRSVRRNSI